MARRYTWTPDKYKAALQGRKDEGVTGLRSIARGFEAKDGFDLRDIESWTAAQRRKVRDTFRKAEQLQAQEKTIVRPRSERNLKRLQDSFHGDVPSKQFKVAFVPYHQPKTALPGAKKRAPKVRLLRDGVSVETPYYDRVFIPFNQKALARNAQAEIKRAASHIQGASLYYVQTGDNQTLRGKSLNLVTSEILKWMHQYDGVKPLPQSSGNRGDSPKHHHWKYWLNGLVGYVLPKRTDVRKLAQIIRAGRLANEEEKRKRRNLMKRKRLKKG